MEEIEKYKSREKHPTIQMRQRAYAALIRDKQLNLSLPFIVLIRVHSWLKLFVLALLFFASHARCAEPPEIPVGLDAYRQWDRWPYQRIGARAYMRSTYDRRGGNEGADASHFLFQRADDFNVTLDLQGPGILYF